MVKYKKPYQFNSLPINGLRKVSDLIEYDGPVLSHYMDKLNVNYLSYWVDYNSDVNRWLIWRISPQQLNDYLHKKRSLKDLLYDNNKDFIFSAELDRDNKYQNVVGITVDQIPSEYTLEENSFYVGEPPLTYSVNEPDDFYLNSLIANSLIFKISPRSLKFGSTVPISYAAKFLTKLSNSFKAYTEHTYLEVASKIYSNYYDLTKSSKTFLSITEPRLVLSEINSFEIGLGVDKIRNANNSNEIKEVQRTLVSQYTNDVVNVDYDSNVNLSEIIENYPIETRKKIFDPYIDLISNSEFKFEARNDNDKWNYKPYRKYNKNRIRTLAEEKEKMSTNEKTKLVNVIIQLKEDEDLESITKKKISSGLLFQNNIDSALLKFNSLSHSGSEIRLKKAIKLTVKSDGKFLSIHNKELKIEYKVEDKTEIPTKLYSKLYDRYQMAVAIEDLSLINKILSYFDFSPSGSI